MRDLDLSSTHEKHKFDEIYFLFHTLGIMHLQISSAQTMKQLFYEKTRQRMQLICL